MSWVGGKKALREAIVTRLCHSCDRYVEVFGGGGWVLFHMLLGNEEAKLNGMEGNRRLGGGIYAGPIFVTRDDGKGGLCDLTDEQVQKYSEMFAEPHDISPEETRADVGFTFYGW